MRSIVCRIRKKYFDAVLRGDKEVEWRKDSEYWRARLDRYVEIPNPGLIIVLICGKRVHRRKVRIIYKLPTPTWFSEQGKKDVSTPYAYAISMGDEVKLCQCACGCRNIVEDPMRFYYAVYRLYRYYDLTPEQIADHSFCAVETIRKGIGRVFKELCLKDQKCVFRKELGG